MTTRATGTFEVKLNPERPDDHADGAKLTITVVPDSGTEQLAGIVGTMTITIADGKHSYDFDYTLP